jgi:hypothetical protein
MGKTPWSARYCLTGQTDGRMLYDAANTERTAEEPDRVVLINTGMQLRSSNQNPIHKERSASL